MKYINLKNKGHYILVQNIYNGFTDVFFNPQLILAQLNNLLDGGLPSEYEHYNKMSIYEMKRATQEYINLKILGGYAENENIYDLDSDNNGNIDITIIRK